MKPWRNNVLKLKIFFLTLCIVFVFLGTGYAKNSPTASAPAKNNPSAQKPQYVPDEIIIKLKPEVQGKISITTNLKNNVITGLNSLDKLNKKYGSKKIQAVLRKLTKKDLRLQKIDTKISETNSEIQKLQSQTKKTRQQKQTLQDLLNKKQKLLESRNKVAKRLEHIQNKRRKLLSIYVVKLGPGANLEQAVAEYGKDPHVEYAEPNYIYSINSTFPDDPKLNNQWGLHNTGQTGGVPDADIDAPEAWDFSTGIQDTIVGVIDTGVDYTHEDLGGNTWINTDEIPGNGLDDDGNGYVDDIYGINSITGSGDPMDDQGHGTHCAGIIGAAGNNGKGIAGVNWAVSIMALKFLNAGGSGSSVDAITCIDYAINMGAHVLSNSWGGSGYSNALKDIIEVANDAGILFVVSAGNNGTNNDVTPYYPASYDNENIIAVAATDHNDNLASFSCYGADSVDVAAPGVNILSTLLPGAYLSASCNDIDGDGYGNCSGTSMACPHVAGLAALVWAKYGLNDVPHKWVNEHIVSTVDQLPLLAGLVKSEGRVNAYNALTTNNLSLYFLAPAYGPEGTIVSIWGSGFGDIQGTSFVSFNGINPTVLSWSSNKIEFVVPEGAATGEVTVTVAGITSKGVEFTLCSYNTYYRDSDGDNFGDLNNPVQDCFLPDGYVTDNTDCDDSDTSIHPGAIEACNGKDNNCNGTIDDDCQINPTILFPGDGRYSTIQEAINVSADGYTILVASGTYVENIDFKGKQIAVRSESGPDETIIQGSGSGSVVTFNSGEGPGALLEGFRIIGGNGNLVGSLTEGGGIFCSGASPTITDCIISGNSASAYGGGIVCLDASPTITKCTITDNTAGVGAGIYCDLSSPTITNSVISRNFTKQHSLVSFIGGGGIACNRTSLTIINSTISENESSVQAGGGIACNNSCTLSVINSIIWGNTNAGDQSNNEIFSFDYYNLINITYSNIKGGDPDNPGQPYPGEGNIDENPLFMGNNYYLSSGSPCINTGTSTDAPSEDKEGIPRPQGLGIDMGAYEYVDTASCIPRAAFTFDQTRGTAPFAVEFDASASGGSQYAGAVFDWNFGDGLTASGMTVSHTYNNYGHYDVKLSVTTACGTHTLKLEDLIKVNSATVNKEVGKSGYTYNSIQAAIDAASNGEFILVHDGVYYENVNYKGKAIAIRSENGPNSTIIDGGGNGSVVTFNSREDESSLLEGFTVTNGSHANLGYVSVYGGGINCQLSYPIITNCIIRNNDAYVGGGVYYFGIAASPQITNCVITRNSARGGGGIAYAGPFSPAISNCVIKENIAVSAGGGISCSEALPQMVNCIVSDNIAGVGSGIYFSGSSPTIINCTISNNLAFDAGGGMYCWESSIKAVNSILWGDKLVGATDEIYIDGVGNSLDVSYSDVQGGDPDNPGQPYPGEGNIDTDPLFMESYYLSAGSPCIDSGTADEAAPEDKENIARPQGIGFDMGAYEYVSPTSCTPRAVFTADKTKGMSPLTIEFDASASGGGQYAGAVFNWNFGDGSTASGMTVSHTYYEYGYYNVSLTVTTDCGTHTLSINNFIKVASSTVTREVGKSGYAYTSIQEAIDDAVDGELILVHDGTYFEGINFRGKAVTVFSENGPAATVINGKNMDSTLKNNSVVTFHSGERADSVLDGFTLTHGRGTVWKELGKRYGGGIFSHGTSPTITNCIIKNNSANAGGSGIYCEASSAIITNCTIIDNLSRDGGSSGGGICAFSAMPTVKSSVISANAATFGGGIYSSNSILEVSNCLITNNLVFESGGGIYCTAQTEIINCTIAENSILGEYGQGGGIAAEQEASLKVINSILWENEANNQKEIYLSASSSIDITYSDIEGGDPDTPGQPYPGVGNINDDPQFIDITQANYYLNPSSPCIDSGASGGSSEDKEGIIRPQGPGVDMGAYEYVDPLSCTPRATFTVDQTKGTNQLTVTFDGSASGGGQYAGASFDWDFGDGYTDSGMIVSHTYQGYGYHTPSLTITTECGSHTLTLYNLIKIHSSTTTKEVGESGYTYNSIQAAIDEAKDGEFILVHDGTYTENIDFLGKILTVKSQNGPNLTVIDGNYSGSVVTFAFRENHEALLDGFTLTNGTGTPDNRQRFRGGGILCSYSSPTINNCIISNNSADNFGGAGIYCNVSSPNITNCTISDNSATAPGGGIVCHWESYPTVSYCVINNNSALGGGGGIWAMSPITVVNSTISNNTASEDSAGGGIHCASDSTFINCTITGNSATGTYFSSGGGIYCTDRSPVITNCTIADNSVTVTMGEGTGGGIFCGFSSTPKVVNSILWNNTVASNPNQIYLEGGGIDITYSDIQGTWAGEGNIDSDPLFAGSGNYHLASGSPCIDTGTDNVITHPTIPNDDIDGDGRPQGSGYDMGSDEFGNYVIITPADTSRLYVYSSSLQGPDDGLFGEGTIGEGEWDLAIDPPENPSALAEHDPLDLEVDGYLLEGLSSFALAEVTLTDLSGWLNADDSDTFQFLINNQATQDPGGGDGPYGPNGWGHSVAYMLITYDTSPTNGANMGDPMNIKLDLNLGETLYADGVYAEYFMDIGYALGTGLVDYDPVLLDPAGQPNPGLGQFDGYTIWNNTNYSFEEINFSDSIEYSGVIGDQVQVLIALSAYSYSYCGYAWTEATLNPTQNINGQAAFITAQNSTVDEMPYASVKAKITAKTLAKPPENSSCVFGPKRYSRTKGEPNKYNDSFSGSEGTGMLVIENGNEDGTDRISSASININGKRILLSNKLKQDVYKLTIPIELKSENSISVILKGKTTGFVTIKVIQPK